MAQYGYPLTGLLPRDRGESLLPPSGVLLVTRGVEGQPGQQRDQAQGVKPQRWVDQPRAVLLLASHPQTLSDNRPGIKCLRTESRDETGKALGEMLEAAAADNLGIYQHIWLDRGPRPPYALGAPRRAGRPVRNTGVRALEDSQWRVVQSHASTGSRTRASSGAPVLEPPHRAAR